MNAPEDTHTVLIISIKKYINTLHGLLMMNLMLRKV